jgi:hypothetical protein
LSTTSTFKEFKSLDSEVVGKVKLLSGPHTKGQPYEVHLSISSSQFSDREILDQLKSFIGYEKGLDTVKFNYDRNNPAQLTLTMNNEVKNAVQAKSVATSCVQRLIDLKEKKHRCKPAFAVHSDGSRWEQHTQ